MPPRRWAAAAGVVGLAAVWLVLRPEAPGGVAAVVDLLVLPALLFAEVRLLAGPITVPLGRLALFFGLGAVFAAPAALVLERGAGFVVGRSAMSVVGPLVEAVALAVPLVVATLMPAVGNRRWALADTTLAGLSTGLGFLLVQSSLVTGAIHVAPDYQTPLLAGLLRVPASAGSPPTYFVGHALATALIGLALGVGLRFGARPLRLVPAGLALALVVLDHGLFDWRLRHLIDAEAADASGLLELFQQITLEGRLALVLLIGGLVAARCIDLVRGQRSTDAGRPHPGEDVDDKADYEYASAGFAVAEHDEPDDSVDFENAEYDDGGLDEDDDLDYGVLEPGEGPATAARAGAGAEGDAAANAGAGAAEGEAATVARATALRLPAWLSWLALAFAVGVGVALTLLARNRQLGLLDNRRIALAVALVGLAYSLWHLPAGVPRRPETALRHLLGLAAVTTSAMGVLCAVLPTPDAAVPIHGGLILETVLGWGSNVGNLGFVLGLGGLAAPPGTRGVPRFGHRWRGIVWRRLRWSGWSGKSGSKRRGAGRYERISGRGRDKRVRHRHDLPGERPRGSFLWLKVSRGRWGGLRRVNRKGRGRAAGGDVDWDDEETIAVAVTIEPIHRAPGSQIEFVGATVKDAIEAAMRQVRVDLAHSALQLVDEGSPAKPGKPGSGRPARVRVAEAGEAGRVLVPPARDSITRDTMFVVNVEVPGDADDEPPPAVTVTVRDKRAPRAQAKTLTCTRADSPPERVRYRSNPYSVESGEDVTWASAGTGDPVAPVGGIRVGDGGQVVVQHRGARASITVHDSWAHQALAVNRWLFDLTEKHLRRAVAELEERLEALEEDDGEEGEADPIRGRIERLEEQLRLVAEGRQALSAGTDDGVDDDATKAFRSTAALHAAMSVEDQDVLDAGAGGDMSLGAYIQLLDQTTVGKLWSDGAYSEFDVALLLDWRRFIEDDA